RHFFPSEGGERQRSCLGSRRRRRHRLRKKESRTKPAPPPGRLEQAEQMLDVASEKTPDLLAQEGEDGDGEHKDLTAANPGTPPLSPSRYRKPSSGKEEDAMWSLMKLATPVKSPGLRAACGDNSAGGAGAGAGANASSVGGGAEMTPVSLFNKSRQPGEVGGNLQSPFQSPFKNFQFSPNSLFSPPGAVTLDFPLVGGDTPGPGPAGSNRSELWQQTTPDRRANGQRGGADGKPG
ncbi:unnamed protein product, partial [Scytosiphon promiscuus]